MQTLFKLILLSFVTALIVSCKKKPVPYGTLYFHIGTTLNMGQTPVTKADTVIDPSTALKLRIDVADFYISAITLYQKGNAVTALSKVHILKTIENELYYVGNIAAGYYDSMSLCIGVDPTKNKTDPGSYPADHALAFHSPEMWFGTPEKGYIFMNVQGIHMWDSSISRPASSMPFSLKVGTDQQYVRITPIPNMPVIMNANDTTNLSFTADFTPPILEMIHEGYYEVSPWVNDTQLKYYKGDMTKFLRYAN